MKSRRIVLSVLLCAALGCAAAHSAGRAKLPNDIAWCESDAYKACVLQAWIGGAARLRELAKTEKPGGWCVVLDADETIISNLEFQKMLAATGTSHSRKNWTEWCEKAAATALPGAKEYCALVRELGGRVIIVTNRDGGAKAAALKNLDALGFAYDAVIFREGPYAWDRNKTMRREGIEKGTVKTLPEGKGLPPLKILMLGGDKLHDLYDGERVSFDQVKDRFAKDLIVLPNPMY